MKSAYGCGGVNIDYVAGKIQVQYVQCGKADCYCSQGDLHGTYYYRIWRDGMRTRKVYVKPGDAEAVRAACKANAERMASLRKIRQQRRLYSGELRSATQSLIRNRGV